MFENYYGRKKVKKLDIDALGIDLSIFKDCFDKETPKMYEGLHMDKYIEKISGGLEDKSLSIKDQIKYELEYLEYITYSNPKAPEGMYYVVEVKFYKDKTKPYLNLYDLKTGAVLKTKIISGKDFTEHPFQTGDIINVTEFKKKNKMKMINGKWTKTSETEKIVAVWNVY